MYVRQIATIFQSMIDEQDSSYQSTAATTMYLALGYEEFRRHVTAVDPAFFEEHATITLSNAQSYDLGGLVNPVRLLGPSLAPAGTKRLLKLLSIAKMTNAVDAEYYLTAARSSRDLGYFNPRNYKTPTYYLSNTILLFGEPLTGSYKLNYTPESTVDWSKTASNQDEWVDDLSNFHDLIAYFAARIYMAKDGLINPALAAMVGERQQQLVSFVQSCRAVESFDSVNQEY